MVDFTQLAQVLDARADAGETVSFWLRDDDAISETPELQRLASWGQRAETDILLAVIPSRADETLAEYVHEKDLLVPCIHGWAHKNHAPPDEKKMELGAHRRLDEVLDELRTARARLDELFGGNVLDVLVPPWNRIAPDVVAELPALGFVGLSTFANQYENKAATGFTIANTHIDVIDWKGTRGCREHEDIATDLCREAAVRQHIGLLTHHLVHDESVWAFLDEVADFINTHTVARWMSPRKLF